MNDLHKRFPLYAKALRLYPPSYRERYEDEVLQTTADMLDDAQSIHAKLAIWTKVTLDLPLSLGRQQFAHTEKVILQETPGYIKRNSLLASALLLPFFIALIANSLDKIIYNHTLLQSWLWKPPVIGIWILYLPELVLLLAFGSYLSYLRTGSSTGKRTSAWQRAIDIPHAWPLLIPAIVACSILFVIAFHDSAQCIIHSPLYVASHAQQVWQCTMDNQTFNQEFKRFL